jgi:hypothetical protein
MVKKVGVKNGRGWVGSSLQGGGATFSGTPEMLTIYLVER